MVIETFMTQYANHYWSELNEYLNCVVSQRLKSLKKIINMHEEGVFTVKNKYKNSFKNRKILDY